MKAARVYEVGKIVMDEVPVPKLGEKDVLIKVQRAGICGSDVGILHGHGRAKFPRTLGHEFCGTVAQLGNPNLGGFKEGDPVLVRGSWPCGECDLCQSGNPRFCRNRQSLGRNADGCMAEFVRVNYRIVFPMPKNVSFDEGQNFVNIACVLRAFMKLPPKLGKSVAIFGPGNMGMIMLQLVKIAGCSHAIMVGTREFRLELARKFGASQTVNVKKENSTKAILEKNPEGVDMVVEAHGNAAAFHDCFEVLKPRGSVVSLGSFSEKVKELDLSFLYAKEPVLYGSQGGEGYYNDAIKLLREKRLQITPMITHRFPLEDTPQAFKTFENRVENAMRIVIEP